jgi:hypothetical protein
VIRTYDGRVGESRWTDFIEWARFARAKPTFDREERDYRLRVAAALRELIGAARAGRPLGEPVTAVRERLIESHDTLVAPAQGARLAAWAERDEEGLRQALDDVSLGLARGGLVLGSLLAFGSAPERLPVIRPGPFARLMTLLGEAATPLPDVVAEYERQRAFVEKVDSRLREAGVPVRDTIDVESLITVCAMQHELWTGVLPEGDGRRAVDPESYLAICTMYRNEAEHLAEWIEFHRLVGVERFFLIDNESDDESAEVLAPYIEGGVVVPYEAPGSAASQTELDAIKIPVFHEVIAAHGADVRWIAFVDTDEFLFSPTGRPVAELLEEYEHWPAVAVNGAFFGTAGHATPPRGLVLENYTRRIKTGSEWRFKSIVDPLAVSRCISAHRFETKWGTTVDENGYPVAWTGNRYWQAHGTKSPSLERLRINHYFARSELDLRAKHARRAELGAVADLPGSDEIQREHAQGIQDEAILRYVPALREALERHAARRTAS